MVLFLWMWTSLWCSSKKPIGASSREGAYDGPDPLPAERADGPLGAAASRFAAVAPERGRLEEDTQHLGLLRAGVRGGSPAPSPRGRRRRRAR